MTAQIFYGYEFCFEKPLDRYCPTEIQCQNVYFSTSAKPYTVSQMTNVGSACILVFVKNQKSYF